MVLKLLSRFFLFAFLLSGLATSVPTVRAQTPIGFVMPEKTKFVEVGFELKSNLVIIPVKINNKISLKFILDSGAETCILTEKIFGNFLGLNYVRKITVQAPGIMESIEASVASGVRLSLFGGLVGSGISMLVLEEDYLQLSKTLGEDVYGIIGHDLFQRFVVEINYDDNVVTFYDPEKYRPGWWRKEIPMKIKNSKPYINLKIKQNTEWDSLDFLIDTGASHALLIDADNSKKIIMPDKTINTLLGQGLGGEIPGYIGRIGQVKCLKYEFKNVLASFPIPGTYIKAIKRGFEHGTIGGDILSRFNVTFDYPGQKLYLAKGRSYRKKFETNMSGMFLTTSGDNYDSLVVMKVYPDTPAYRAGIRPGQHVLKINGMTADNSNISEMESFFCRKKGTKIKIQLLINGEKVMKEFRLERLI